MKFRVLASLALASMFTLAHAGAPAPQRYTLEWASPTSGATATGFIELDRNLVTTPGVYSWFLPDPAVLDFGITVTGSASGDGTWTIADYSEIRFDTNGGALDLDMELVGQPTSGNPWGPTNPPRGDIGFDSGDFNIFVDGQGNGTNGRYDDLEAPSGVGPFPPTGVFFFEIAANGGSGESMLLTSFRPAGVPQATAVPALSKIGLALLLGALTVFGTLAMARRTS